MVNLEVEENKKTKKFAIQIADVIAIKDNEIDVMTKGISIDFSEVSSEFEEKNSKPKEKSKASIDFDNGIIGIRTRNGKKKEATIQKFKDQNKRTKHQIELKKKKQN